MLYLQLDVTDHYLILRLSFGGLSADFTWSAAVC